MTPSEALGYAIKVLEQVRVVTDGSPSDDVFARVDQRLEAITVLQDLHEQLIAEESGNAVMDAIDELMDKR